jgi:hypothetical protein
MRSPRKSQKNGYENPPTNEPNLLKWRIDDSTAHRGRKLKGGLKLTMSKSKAVVINFVNVSGSSRCVYLVVTPF